MANTFLSQQGSSYSRTANTTTKGSLREGTLDDVQWHPNGSFYIKKGDRHLWNFSAHSVSSAWNEMWEGQRRDERIRSIVEELAVSNNR
jgi:methylenetetrahydrofolate dehydrogenase (NADP+)/methenyltetrahydrofolate cyclohydrolase/formyltetrahydrofolate synthetase